MIKYQLHCDSRHTFESWFSNSAAYDDQRVKGHVTCPTCGSGNVEKALMAPQVAPKGSRMGGKGGKGKVVNVAANHAMQKEAMDLMRKVRDHVVENADNVGDKFAEEARKIHYEEVEPRGIYGQATQEESKELKDEGVEFHPLPVLPEDQN